MERTLKTNGAQLETEKLVFAFNPHSDLVIYSRNASFSPASGIEGTIYKLDQNPASWNSEGQHIRVEIKE